jgi:hypothetical protein
MGLDLYFWKIRKDIVDKDQFESSSDIIDVFLPPPENVKLSEKEWFHAVYTLDLIQSTYEDKSETDFIIPPSNREQPYISGCTDICSQYWLEPIIPDGSSNYGLDALPDFYYDYYDKRDECYTKELVEWLYFRKANHVHAWFVKNLQHGVDDCHVYKITPEIVNKLLNDSKEAIQNSKLAHQYFPITTGFFFGQFEYTDPFYIDCLKKLYKSFKELSKSSWYYKEYNIYYRASW